MSVLSGWPLVLSALLLIGCQEGSPATPSADPESVGESPRGTDGDVYVVLLGTGTPQPDTARAGPATAVIAWGHAYLVDMGRGVVDQAYAASLDGVDALALPGLTRVFVTHLHSDHILGYPALIAIPTLFGRSEPLRVMGPPGIEAMTDHFVAGLAEDFRVRPTLKDRSPGSIVVASAVEPGVIYEDLYVRVTAFPVRHGEWKHAFGYRFDTRTRTIVVSGDTAPTEEIVKACNGCDVLVHEVYCADGVRSMQGPPSFLQHNRDAHTSALELGKLAARARPRRLVLTHVLHYGCSDEDLVRTVRQQFAGEIVVGEDLSIH